MPDSDTLSAALDAISDPATGQGLIAAGRAAPPRLANGVASVVLDVSGLSGDARVALERAIRQELGRLEGVTEVRVAMTAERIDRRSIAIASGKGGVGKSTVAANLAVALARSGWRIGMVDADIYGPSQPRLLNRERIKPTAVGQKLNPVDTDFGLKMLSMGQLVEPGKAIAWRGPMAAGALGQLVDADWGDIELLVIDLPPGTGDVQLSMIQKHRPAGAVIVSTPQDLALIDATRAIDLFRQANVPIIGLIENMAGYRCPHCGELSDPFGAGGAEAAAKELGIPFLGRLPLEIGIRTASDAGKPPAAEPGSPFDTIADAVGEWMNRAPTQRL
jgi:ATP-binding protein involved in chromosome partitioning